MRWFRAKKFAVLRSVSLPIALLALLAAVVLLFVTSAKDVVVAPRLGSDYFLTGANARLPVHGWVPSRPPIKAVIVALHGFNDYGRFFSAAGDYFKDLSIASYSYDQRGFGGAADRGYWAGIATYTRDLEDFVRLIRERHPGVPLYLLGESMGAAVIIVAMTNDRPPDADGVILSAPAVWDWTTVPWYQRAGLSLAAHTIPWLRLTGASLHLVPSDNIEMLRALSRDPMVIKESRVGAIYGLTDLMRKAFERVKLLHTSTLVLYGERDEIIPKRSVYRMVLEAPPIRSWRVAFYENGYHLLLRDLEADALWRDIAAWIDNPRQRLPSGADKRAAAALADGQ